MKQRRKAIDGKMIEESKTSPGYFKYQFTILELDGTKNEVPAYGKDMEDALERLVWVERIEKKSFNVVLISALLSVIIIPSIIAAITNNWLFVIGSLVLAIIYGIVMVRVDKYFNKN
jgi:hypothetical protein